MHIHKTVQEYLSWRRSIPVGETIGFIATMGALHEGHKALIETGVKENTHAVVSIFINPIQFNSAQDLKTYPQTLESDLQMCREAGVKAVFAPEAGEMYSSDHLTYCAVEKLDKSLCGATRPGHFKGVCTVVLKLFNIIEPSVAYFGKKDFQQAVIIKRMAEDLNLALAIVSLETVRLPSGLAVSSRNQRLSSEERDRATAIYRGLSEAKQTFLKGEKDSAKLIQIADRIIKTSQPDKTDYLSVVSQKNLLPVERINEPCIIATAVFYGSTRLIDNVELSLAMR